jgi:hypothetical protein
MVSSIMLSGGSGSGGIGGVRSSGSLNTQAPMAAGDSGGAAHELYALAGGAALALCAGVWWRLRRRPRESSKDHRRTK